MASILIDSAVQKGKKVLFLAHSRELVHQCADKLRDIGVPCGLIMAGEPLEPSRPVQVASKDTLHARAFRRSKMALPPADIVCCDETHRVLGKSWLDLLSMYPNAIILGLTATPARGDGSGLGAVYEVIVEACSTEKLIEDGYLVPCRVFAPFVPNMKGVRKGADGDYDRSQTEKKMDKTTITGDIIAHWKRLSSDRQTLVFASGITHSMHIRDQFREAGVRAAHLDGEMPKDERDELLRRFAAGDIQVVSSCDVLIEGVDLPMCSCVILARPTKSIVRHKQQIGRGMRPHKPSEKRDCVVLDHAGNCVNPQLGFPDEDVEWTLEGKKHSNQKKERPDREPKICKKCFCAYYKAGACPNCGHKPTPVDRTKVNVKDGQLIEVTRNGKTKAEPTGEDHQRYWMYCLMSTGHRGSTPKAAARMFSSHFNKPPWRCKVRPLPFRDEWGVRITELYPGLFKRREG